MKLLIVDDESLEREVLIDIVQKNSLGITQCMEAVNGSTAVDIVKKESIDIVLMDIKMPIMDGITAARIMKLHDPNIKLLFLTAYNDFDYALQTIKIGVEDFLLKPTRPDEIVQALKNVIGYTDHLTVDENFNYQSSVIIGTITEYIDKHLNEKLTLEQMSGIVHLHPQYVGRLFKQEMNITITEYIAIKRIEKSKEMLVNTQKTISEISELCGFSDSNYFTRVFRKFAGFPPSQYRKNEQLVRRERKNRQYFNRIM